MTSAREAEEHALPLWPDVLRRPLGEWELRTDPAPVGRLLKRANSCLAMGDPGLPLGDAADVVRRFYGERGRAPLVQVERGSDVDRAFAGLGWDAVPGGDADFLTAPLARARRHAGQGRHVRLLPDGFRALAELTVDDVVVARGRGGVHRGWLGVHGLGVHPDHRRRGHARAVMAALLGWGAAHGATTVWLHVETDNRPALAMYAALGLRHHHGNRYRAAPEE